MNTQQTLKQLIEQAINSDTESQLAEVIRAAYWAGLEKGRGETVRQFNEARDRLIAALASLRYHQKPIALTLTTLPKISGNDESDEILNWEFNLII